MRAFFSDSTNQYVAAVEYYSRAVEILEWGRHTWKDVPLNDRGPIFELTFIRGVKRLYMTALMGVGHSHKSRPRRLNFVPCYLIRPMPRKGNTIPNSN